MRPQVYRCCWIRIILVFCVATFCAVLGDIVRYDSHKLYEIRLEPGLSSRIRRQIDKHIILDHDKGQQSSSLTVLVEPHEAPEFETLLKNNSISHNVLDINLQTVIDDESKNIKPLNVSVNDFGWKNFYQLETIYAWLDMLAENYSDLITPLNIGKSYEGRPLKGVKLSYKESNTAVFIEAGIHAKEWISTAAATFLLNQLLTSTDSKVRNIARNFDWIVFPVINPDGYKYTFDGDRLWRKNRQPFGNCYGVDLNRNWNSSWNNIVEEEDSQPCGRNYPGPYVFSAPETTHFVAYLRNSVQSQRIQTYLSFHAAAQKLLFPYAANSSEPPNNNDLQRIGEKAVQALEKRYGKHFEVGGAYHIMYAAPGTSTDWVYGELNVPIVYSYELRRSKEESTNFQDRFLLPVDQIEAAGWETLDSVVALLNEAKTLGYYSVNSSSYSVFTEESTHHYVLISYGIGLSALLVVVLIGIYVERKYKLFWSRRSDDGGDVLYRALL